MLPSVSVVVPTYNGADFVADAVESVLSQTHEDFELLVVDDGSTDDTLDVVRAFDDPRIQIHENDENLGIARNMNHGVELAAGELLAFLDQDDRWKPNKLERHVAAHDADDAAVVYSDVDVVSLDGERIERQSPPAPRPPGEPLVRQLYVSLNFVRTFSCVTIARSAWTDVGGLDPSLTLSADYDLYLRLAAEYAFARIDEPLAEKRSHEENTSGDHLALYEDIQRILSDARERHPYLRDLSPAERQRYGFEQAFCSYRAGKRGEAFDYCLTSLRHGPRPLTVLLFCVLLLDRVSGPLSLGTRGYRLYKKNKSVLQA